MKARKGGQWKACLRWLSSKVLENVAKERIVVLRNAVWTHLNHLSQQCVTDDEVGSARRRRHTTAAVPPFCVFRSCTRR